MLQAYLSITNSDCKQYHLMNLIIFLKSNNVSSIIVFIIILQKRLGCNNKQTY